MNIPLIFWIVPAAAVIALAVAWAFYRSMKREDEGTPRMREIAEQAGTVFAWWTFANLAPRAASLRRRYEQEFGEEFSRLRRKRIIPFIY